MEPLYRTELPGRGYPERPQGRRKGKGPLLFIIILAAAILAWFIYFASPPSSFVPDTLIDIPSGYSLKQIGQLLEDRSIVRSSALFSMLVSHANKEKGVLSGQYLFKSPEYVWQVAERMSLGKRGIETRKVTFPEGTTARGMAETLSRSLPSFDKNAFLALATPKDGYLFPDTYFFFTTATSGEIVSTLGDNFTKKTDALHEEAQSKNKNWGDIVTMASILEREAASSTDRRIISGILWKRIDRGMRLEVDATLYYLLGKPSSELTQSDLDTDSPYNTYTHDGLPPGPIGNPGLDALDAALHPKETNYLYYLSDDNGVMHYSRTFEEHKMNKAKYLR